MSNSLQKLTCVGAEGRSRYDAITPIDIFLCIHQADRKNYQELITNLFLSAGTRFWVWTHKSNSFQLMQNEAEQYLKDLRENALMVVCVTENFLRGDDLCLWEFQNAKNMGMKILPLLADKGISERFNHISGNMQALLLSDDDPTAVPFKWRFAHFLDQTFSVNDEMQEILQKLFVANLFVSYRKKDRYYVKMMLQQLQTDLSLAFCGIWYDEMENAGEAFDNQIWDSFARADLGIILLTRNMLEEGNYVATKEYPFICRNHKPCIAVLADDVDPAEVSDFFVRTALEQGINVDPISKYVQLSDRDGLIHAIKAELTHRCNVNFAELSASKERMFWLGKAYLTGYLVEQNTRIALRFFELIRPLGVIEAYEIITEIYEKGIGCKVNLNAAVNAQECYVDYLFQNRRQFEQHPPLNIDETYMPYPDRLCEALMHMIRLYRDTKDEREIFTCEVFQTYILSEMQHGKPEWSHRLKLVQLDLAKALMSFGKYAQAFPIFKEVKDYYLERGEEMLRTGRAKLGNVAVGDVTQVFGPEIECFHGMSRCRKNLTRTQEDAYEAISYLRAACEIKEKLWKKYQDPWARRTLHIDYQALTILFIHYRCWEEAKRIADIDYQVLYQLDLDNKMGREELYAAVMNSILSGDIAEHIRPQDMQGYYRLGAETYMMGLQKGYARDERLERMLATRGVLNKH